MSWTREDSRLDIEIACSDIVLYHNTSICPQLISTQPQYVVDVIEAAADEMSKNWPAIPEQDVGTYNIKFNRDYQNRL